MQVHGPNLQQSAKSYVIFLFQVEKLTIKRSNFCFCFWVFPRLVLSIEFNHMLWLGQQNILIMKTTCSLDIQLGPREKEIWLTTASGVLILTWRGWWQHLNSIENSTWNWNTLHEIINGTGQLSIEAESLCPPWNAKKSGV